MTYVGETMKKSSLEKRIPRVITIGLVLLLLVAVFFLMQYVQSLLNADVKINLTEIVTQNKDVISSKLKVEVNSLDTKANQIADYLKQKPEVNNDTIKEAYFEYNKENLDKDIFVAASDGTAWFSDGAVINISGRKYFRLAMEGSQNISDRTVSRLNGEELFAISVPLYNQGKVVGTVQKQYTPQEMYSLCSLSLFSSKGSMYIINSDGYILISSDQRPYNSESDNYYRTLYQDGNRDASKTLENNIRNNGSGFMETTVAGKKYFSAYTPLEELHDWYLISSVDTNAVSPNAATVFKLFYFVLTVVIIILGVIMLYFFAYKNKQQSNLKRIAFVDEVTGGNTYNKFVVDLHELLEQHLEDSYSLLVFDIDNFKYVNSFYGFDEGDKILKRIDRVINDNLMNDECIARISGDHFVALLKDVSQERMENMLKLAMENDGGITLYYTAGLYKIKDPQESVNIMVDKATVAANSAKGMLRKKIEIYTEKYEQTMIYNEQLKRSVEKALKNDEMVPYYQPKVNVNTGELVGAEALARWLQSDGKLIPPFEFIPMCEKTGLITDLDMIIFEKTLKFLRRNIDRGIKCVPISVNFSRLHLNDIHFFDKVTELISRYDVPPEYVEIELTESAIFDNHELISDFTHQLHKYGLKISMDDFGSGYSSLNMLKDIPIDVLKIDRGFLEETSNSDKQRIILSTIANMANQLNIKVVVEGVETIENVNLMKEFGCYIAQGYYFAKPMAEVDFEKIFEEGVLL